MHLIYPVIHLQLVGDLQDTYLCALHHLCWMHIQPMHLCHIAAFSLSSPSQSGNFNAVQVSGTWMDKHVHSLHHYGWRLTGHGNHVKHVNWTHQQCDKCPPLLFQHSLQMDAFSTHFLCVFGQHLRLHATAFSTSTFPWFFRGFPHAITCSSQRHFRLQLARLFSMLSTHTLHPLQDSLLKRGIWSPFNQQNLTNHWCCDPCLS